MDARIRKPAKRPTPIKIGRRIEGPWARFLHIALQWAGAWGLVALALGILLMLGKTPPFAESGGRPGNVLSYSFWAPTLAIGGAAAGLGIGVLYACLMAVTSEWRESIEDTSLVARMGPYALCGGGAGLIAGLLVGSFTGALFFAVLAGCSAVALNWRTIRAS